MDNVTPTRKKRTQRDYNLGFKLAVVDKSQRRFGRRSTATTGQSTEHKVLRVHPDVLGNS